MRPWALVALATALFAGCADEGASGGGLEIAAGKGAIRGLVVDPAFAPVEGATVSLAGAHNVTTNATGLFVFVDLEPGEHFVSVSKPGWTTVQQAASVEADVAEPPVLKVTIEKLPGTEPRALSFKQEGFISCSWGAYAYYGDCNTVDQQMSRLFFDIPGRPDRIQTEVVWDSTQPLGEWLYIIQAVCTCDGQTPDDFDLRFDETADATSIYVTRVSQGWIKTHDVGGANVQLVVDASASGPEPETTNGSGLALNQDFEVYTTFFYNILEPDPEWTFYGDGEYPVPEP